MSCNCNDHPYCCCQGQPLKGYLADHYYDKMCPLCYLGYGCKGDLCEKHAKVQQDKPNQDTTIPPQD